MIYKLRTWQIVAIALVAVFTLFITWRVKALEKRLSQRQATTAMLGKKAPDFSLPALDGGNVSLADYKGKRLIINYWASWCGPCRMEMPTLKEFYAKYHKEHPDFELLAISIDDDRDEAAGFATKSALPFPVLLDLKKSVADSYSVDSIPTTFVIDHDGKVILANTGYSEVLEFQLTQKLGFNAKAESDSKDSSE